jgi:hypothetical protein
LIRTSYEDVDPLLYSKGSKVVTDVLKEVVRQAPPSSQWFPRFLDSAIFWVFQPSQTILAYTPVDGPRYNNSTKTIDQDKLRRCKTPFYIKGSKVVTDVLKEVVR